VTNRVRITPPPPPEIHRPELPSAIRIGVGTRSRKDRFGWWLLWSALAATLAQVPFAVAWLGFDLTPPRGLLVAYEALVLAALLVVGVLWMGLPFLQDWVRFAFQLLAWWRADQQTTAAHRTEVASREGHTDRWFTHRPKEPETRTINTGDVVDQTARAEVAALRAELEATARLRRTERAARARVTGAQLAPSPYAEEASPTIEIDISAEPVPYLDSTEYQIVQALIDEQPITVREWVPRRSTKATFTAAINNLIAAQVLVGQGGNRSPKLHGDLERVGEGSRHAMAAQRLGELPDPHLTRPQQGGG
jgi:hypothetical protein